MEQHSSGRSAVQQEYPNGSGGGPCPAYEATRNWAMFCTHVDRRASYAAIAQEHGITTERVRQIVHRVDRNIRLGRTPWSGLPARTINALRGGGIKHPSETCVLSDDYLLDIRGFGKGQLAQLRAAFPADSPRSRLINALTELQNDRPSEYGHMAADAALLEYIDDPEIAALFEGVAKYYS